MTIYVSSGLFSNLSVIQIKKKFNEYKIKNIEFSGGKYDPNLHKILKENFLKDKICLHNYFPPPKKNFVINLATDNPDLSKKSLKQIFKSINMCKDLRIPFFSFHAGFLIDPHINELGKIIANKRIIKKKIGIKNFINNLERILEFGLKKKVIPIIENNVSSLSNYNIFKKNVFLMSEPQEIIDILEKFNGQIKLLMDVGHFNVSSKTLNFNKKHIKTLNKYIIGYHLSDNDGLHDLNGPFTEHSWFWKYINKNLNYYVVEVYEKKLDKIKNCYDILQGKLEL